MHYHSAIHRILLHFDSISPTLLRCMNHMNLLGRFDSFVMRMVNLIWLGLMTISLFMVMSLI
ncbi:hypothetical protein V428_09650 [Aeromonas hydrophila subsp. hydrophila AL09-71]|nr:hypothetical protein AHML_09390 [Aeromonas hydrophila ML09-119]AHX32345.1 hypothetical protein V428_09650 [Aeromonas hydrophila subsp. hydrophila AL09-71]